MEVNHFRVTDFLLLNKEINTMGIAVFVIKLTYKFIFYKFICIEKKWKIYFLNGS